MMFYSGGFHVHRIGSCRGGAQGHDGRPLLADRFLGARVVNLPACRRQLRSRMRTHC